MDAELGKILAFRRLSPLLASSGQPEPSGITAIGRAGFKHLLNLALPTSPGALVDEATLAERLFRELEQLRAEPVFVHCAKSMRVSALLSAYRMVLGGVSSRVAHADLHAIWEPNHTWHVKGHYRDTLVCALTETEYWSRPARPRHASCTIDGDDEF